MGLDVGARAPGERSGGEAAAGAPVERSSAVPRPGSSGSVGSGERTAVTALPRRREDGGPGGPVCERLAELLVPLPVLSRNAGLWQSRRGGSSSVHHRIPPAPGASLPRARRPE